MLRLGAAGGAGGALAAVLAACGEAPAAEVQPAAVTERARPSARAVSPAGELEPVRGGTLAVSSYTLTMEVLNPIKCLSTTNQMVNDVVWLQLWYGDSWGEERAPTLSGEWEAGAADRWEEIEPSRVYRFHINSAVKWHDGTPVTSADVVWGYHMALHPAYGQGFANHTYAPIEGAKAWAENPTANVEDSGGVSKIDDMTVQIELERPDPGWWTRACKDRSINLPPMPKHLYQSLDPEQAFEGGPYATAPVGNGPFKVTGFDKGRYVELALNPEFAYGAPWVDGYVIRYGDENARDAAMAAGELDFHRASRLGAFQGLAPHAHLTPQLQRSPWVNGLQLNEEKEIFQGVEVPVLLEGMILAVDRQSINQSLNAGTLFLTDYLYDHISLMRDPPPDAYVPHPYDPERARQLIAQSGFDTRNTIHWIVWSQPDPTALAKQAYWAEVGLKVEFLIIDNRAVIEEVYLKRRHDLVVLGSSGLTTVQAAWRTLKCGYTYDQGGQNACGHCDPELDALFEEAIEADTQEELRERWLDISRRLHGHGTVLIAPTWYGALLNLYHRRVQGPYWLQTYTTPFRPPVERVWIDPRWDGAVFSG